MSDFQTVTDETPYLIWSKEHRAWWKPNCLGYAHNITFAGRYPRREAIELCRAGGSVPVSEADAIAIRP